MKIKTLLTLSILINLIFIIGYKVSLDNSLSRAKEAQLQAQKSLDEAISYTKQINDNNTSILTNFEISLIPQTSREEDSSIKSLVLNIRKTSKEHQFLDVLESDFILFVNNKPYKILREYIKNHKNLINEENNTFRSTINLETSLPYETDIMLEWINHNQITHDFERLQEKIKLDKIK